MCYIPRILSNSNIFALPERSNVHTIFMISQGKNLTKLIDNNFIIGCLGMIQGKYIVHND